MIQFLVLISVSGVGAGLPCGVVDLTKGQAPLLKSTSKGPWLSYVRPGGHFEILYTMSQPEAVPGELETDGVPVYVHGSYDALEKAWRVFVDSLGYPAPGSCYDSRQKTRLYRVELREPGEVLPAYRGAYGLTIQCSFGKSYLILENDFRKYVGGRYLDFISRDPFGDILYNYSENPQAGLDVTAAHEFYHAVQFAMTGSIHGFWTEASAVWAEERVFPQHNDYLQYLNSVIVYPETSLTAINYSGSMNMILHPYGEGIWPMHLAGKYGDGIILRAWHLLARTDIDVNNLFSRLLNSYTGGVNRSFSDFALSLFFSAKNFDPSLSSFPDAEKFPDLPVRGNWNYQQDLALTLNPLSFTCKRLAGVPPGWLELSIKSAAASSWSVLLIKKGSDSNSVAVLGSINGKEGRGWLEIDEQQEVFVMVVYSGNEGKMDFTLQARTTTPAPGTFLSNLTPWEGGDYLQPVVAWQYWDVSDTVQLQLPGFGQKKMGESQIYSWNLEQKSWNQMSNLRSEFEGSLNISLGAGEKKQGFLAASVNELPDHHDRGKQRGSHSPFSHRRTPGLWIIKGPVVIPLNAGKNMDFLGRNLLRKKSEKTLLQTPDQLRTR